MTPRFLREKHFDTFSLFSQFCFFLVGAKNLASTAAFVASRSEGVGARKITVAKCRHTGDIKKAEMFTNRAIENVF